MDVEMEIFMFSKFDTRPMKHVGKILIDNSVRVKKIINKKGGKKGCEKKLGKEIKRSLLRYRPKVHGIRLYLFLF